MVEGFHAAKVGGVPPTLVNARTLRETLAFKKDHLLRLREKRF